MSKACDWCKKEERAFFYFWKPRDWVKHRTPDRIEMLFCSLKCFEAFTCNKPRLEFPKPKEPEKAAEESVIVAYAQ